MPDPAARSLSLEEGRRASIGARFSSSPDSGMALNRLIDDFLVEILLRVPARSLCRCKLVSKRWLSLIDHPYHRKRIQQPLAGFFYNSTSEARFPRSALHFVNASGCGRPFICPSFAFLPSRLRLDLLDCCNGLLLCRWYGSSAREDEFQYVVCNPVTEEWAALPDPGQAAGEVGMTCLGFDAAVSSHFHVFVFLVDFRRYLTGVCVYSSETGGWIHKEDGWDDNISLAYPRSATVFLNGLLHFRTVCGDQLRPCIAAVDTKGEAWSNFETPGGILGFIQQLQGRLYYVSLTNGNGFDVQVQIYALKCYTNKEWILKHRVGAEEVEEFNGVTQRYFEWVAIDPECNSVFFIEGSNRKLRRYDMDHRGARGLLTLGEGHTPYLPYVPLYSELESLHK